MLTKQIVIVDLFVHSSGPFGGPFFVWGGSSEPREPPPPPPPPLATALIGFYGAGRSHFECCWIALGAKPRVD